MITPQIYSRKNTRASYRRLRHFSGIMYAAIGTAHVRLAVYLSGVVLIFLVIIACFCQ